MSLFSLPFLVCLISILLNPPAVSANPSTQLAFAKATSPQYQITFYINTNFGGLTFNTTRYQNRSIDFYPYGNYTAKAWVGLCPICPPFDHWSSNGSLKVMRPNDTETNVTISGSGTLSANYNNSLALPIRSTQLLMPILAILIVVLTLKRAPMRFRTKLYMAFD